MSTPCPFINFLLHTDLINNRNVTADDLVNAIRKVNIFDESLIQFIKYFIVIPSVYTIYPLGTILRIEDIKVLEHDISLSRLDKYQGDSILFNSEQFERLLKKSQNGTHLTLQDISDYRKELLVYARKNNPNLIFGTKELLISSGEDAFLQTIFSDTTGNIRLDWLTTFFTTKKLPTESDGFYYKNISLIDWIPVFLTQIKNISDL
jgi:hypothetical protein